MAHSSTLLTQRLARIVRLLGHTMLPESQNTISLFEARSKHFLLYKVSGQMELPLTFDLVNLDGIKKRSISLVAGNEFVIPLFDLEPGEYLYAISAQNGHLRTGVVRV